MKSYLELSQKWKSAENLPKIYSPQTIQYVTCFCIRYGEMYHYITCSPVDHLQWMGAVRMRVQTAAKNITNITVIHTTPVYQLMYCEVKSCTFVRNKSIVKGLIHPKIKFSLCLQEWLLRTTVSRSGKKLYYIWNMDIYLTKTHGFATGGLHSPPGAVWSTFYYERAHFISCLLNCWRKAPAYTIARLGGARTIFKNSDWIHQSYTPRMI